MWPVPYRAQPYGLSPAEHSPMACPLQSTALWPVPLRVELFVQPPPPDKNY